VLAALVREYIASGEPVASSLLVTAAGLGVSSAVRVTGFLPNVAVTLLGGGSNVLIGDRAFCSFAHFALLLRRGLHGLFRAHQKLIVSFRPGRAYNGPGQGRHKKGLPNSCWLRRLGPQDQVVEYFKPKRCPDWLSADDYVLPGLFDLHAHYAMDRKPEPRPE
jgi:hypothetical protein